MARKKHGIKGWLMCLIFKLIVLFVLLFGIALGILWIAETHPPARAGDSQALVVLGAQVYADGSLSPQLEMRMEAALAAYREKPCRIIACGAQGKNEPGPEGEIMRQWLLDRGVPPEDAAAETESRDTRQNLQNALLLLPEGTEKITVVTSDYHLPRALQIARDLGLQADGIGSPCKPEFWVKNHFREVLAWGKYFATKWGIL